MHRNRSVNVHQFSMVPRADIPRSQFRIESSHKTTFDAGLLVPIYVEEVLPGDTFNLKATIFARLATPLTPIMDNLYLDTFFFFVPNRLVWDNWQRFCGERDNPEDTIDFQIPFILNTTNVQASTIFDYMGIPLNIAGDLKPNALPFRAYNLIWNEWFRDENLQDRVTVNRGDTDSAQFYTLLRRGKRHDYFTSCLPFVQKGDPVQLPIGGNAPVKTGADLSFGTGFPLQWVNTTNLQPVTNSGDIGIGTSSETLYNASGITSQVGALSPSNLYADLSEATAATINQIRQAFQIQKLLERDARGGTRYTEVVRSHFGVLSPDARLQRPEYLGGGSTPVQIQSVAQTSGSAPDPATGYTDTPLAWISGYASSVSRNGFTQSFTEHGHVIGLMAVRADLSYQQGLNRMWSRRTRYDYYWPVFAMIGEQAVLNKEIYAQGTSVDDDVFGYQERWAEYRYKPSQISGKLRSTFAQPLDIWHLAQEFTSLPTLNATFIEDNPPVNRVIATTEQTGDQFVADMLFRNKAARPMPLYSVPGLVDHF